MRGLVPAWCSPVLGLALVAACGGNGASEHPAAPAPTTAPVAATTTSVPSTSSTTAPALRHPSGGYAPLHLSGLVVLLASPEVRAEIGFTDAQAAQVDALRAEHADGGGVALRDAAFVDAVLGLLTAPQRAALTRAQVRRLGAGALVNPDVRDALDLTAAQRAQIDELAASYAAAAMRMGSDAGTAGQKSETQAAIVARARETTAKLAAVLTPAQAAALEALGREDGAGPASGGPARPAE